MTIRQSIKDKAYEAIDASDAMARSKFIQWVMKE